MIVFGPSTPLPPLSLKSMEKDNENKDVKDHIHILSPQYRKKIRGLFYLLCKSLCLWECEDVDEGVGKCFFCTYKNTG